MSPRAVPSPCSPIPASLFEKAFYNSPAMQVVVRLADRVFVDVNEAFLANFGYAREEIVGRTPEELDFWASPEVHARFTDELNCQGRVCSFELEAHAKDGTRRTVLFWADVLEVGGEHYVVSAGVDITERQRTLAELRATHERLRHTEERFSQAFRASPAMIVITRFADNRFVSVNEAFLAATGYTEADVIGRSGADLDLHVTTQQRDEFIRVVREQGFARDIELTIRTKAGALRTLLVSAEVTTIDDQPHLLVVGLDITQRKQAEAEQRHALEKERELRQLKTDFVSLVSHEFRTPLEVIMSSADNLDRYHDRLAPEKRRQLLRTINKSVRRMSDMMEDVLLLGRMDSNRVAFKPATFDLAAFCQRLRDEMEAATGRRCPIELETSRLPAKASGDETVIRHILTNLLSNAVKYSAAGTPVTLAVSRDKSAALFRVIDRGCGIPAADQPRLFEAFHRGANVRHIQGTGLGLVIVQRCVALHGGRIDVTTTEGQGATFTVSLPLFARGSRARP